MGQNGPMRAPYDDHTTTVALQRLVVGVGLVAAAVVIGILVVVEADVDLDDWWNWFNTFYAPLQPISLALNYLGGWWFATFVVPLGAAAVLLALRRPWGAVYVILASAMSAAVVQLLKAMFGRPRPEEMIVVSDFGSFPSGHTANAATIAVVAVVLVPQVWVAVVGAAWVFAMAFSRTQVHAHWFSDTVAGTLVGTGMALVAAAILTRWLVAESG